MALNYHYTIGAAKYQKSRRMFRRASDVAETLPCLSCTVMRFLCAMSNPGRTSRRNPYKPDSWYCNDLFSRFFLSED